jgi:LAO/AO transport system kinase
MKKSPKGNTGKLPIRNEKREAAKPPVKRFPAPAEYAGGILRGDRILLSQAITLIESTHPERQASGQAVLELCLPRTGGSIRVGITGSPGVGKSTFIETLGLHLTGQGRKVAVLAIDPSSQVSRGSILGDKTRMNRLAADPAAFIRPTPAGEELGGVAGKTREAMLLCEAAGFDTILVETVGVGQSEVAVHGMVDFFLLLLLPGAGDELQGIKRGIVEMADLLAVNKADGERQAAAVEAKREYARALHLFPPKRSGWSPGVVACSALTGEGIPEIWQKVIEFQQMTQANGWFDEHRRQQSSRWFYEQIERMLKRSFFDHPAVKANIDLIEAEVKAGALPVVKAAEKLLAFYEK